MKSKCSESRVVVLNVLEGCGNVPQRSYSWLRLQNVIHLLSGVICSVSCLEFLPVISQTEYSTTCFWYNSC